MGDKRRIDINAFSGRPLARQDGTTLKRALERAVIAFLNKNRARLVGDGWGDQLVELAQPEGPTRWFSVEEAAAFIIRELEL
jgi:hypothetical protein